jgi:uncharacterized membrane protein YidH (DUF202 family)
MRYFEELRRTQMKILTFGIVGLAFPLAAICMILSGSSHLTKSELTVLTIMVTLSLLIILGAVRYPTLRPWVWKSIYWPGVTGIGFFILICIAWYIDLVGTVDIITMDDPAYIASAVCALMCFAAYWHTHDLRIKALFLAK